jgi:hypothetical protein
MLVSKLELEALPIPPPPAIGLAFPIETDKGASGVAPPAAPDEPLEEKEMLVALVDESLSTGPPILRRVLEVI